MENQAADNSEKNSVPESLKPHCFKPGQSGNPGGRPKKKLIDEKLAELLESQDGADALEIARALIAKAKAGDGLIAKLVAERTQGKPLQKIEHSGEDGGPIQSRVIVEFI